MSACTHRIDKPQDSSCAFHTRANRVELQIVRRSATRRRRVKSRDGRYVSVEARRGEQPKTDEKLCISETECHPSDGGFSQIHSIMSPVSSRPPSTVSRIVALAVAYRYGYGIRHTSRSTNGYFAETTSLLTGNASSAGLGAITNDEGGKSRSNFPLRESKEDPLTAAAEQCTTRRNNSG